MRTLPIALVNLDDEFTFVRDCIYDAIITHGHPRAILGAVVFGIALRYVLDRSNDPTKLAVYLIDRLQSDFRSLLQEDTEIARWIEDWDRKVSASATAFEKLLERTVAETVENLVAIPETSEPTAYYTKLGALDRASRGSGVGTACAAVFQFLTHLNRPTEAVIDAVNELGSDTDTIASLTGALVGAHFGSESVPFELAESVQDHRYLASTAERLHRIARGHLGESVAESKRLERRDAYLQLLAWEIGLHEMFWDALGVGGVVAHPALGRGTITKKDVRTLRRPGWDAKLIHIAFESGQTCVFHSRVENGVRVSESLAEEVQRALA